MSDSPFEPSAARDASSGWTQFWFGSEPDAAARPWIAVPLLVGCISLWFFCSHFRDAGFWFGSTGLLSNQNITGFLVDADLVDAVGWQWSPLYAVDSPLVIRVFLVLAASLAGAAVGLAAVRRYRSEQVSLGVAAAEKWLWMGVWLSVVWLSNRSLLISGPEELALSAATGYVALAQWACCRSLALRLLQIHACILMGCGGLEMLSSTIWWDGTGSVAVAAPSERRFLALADSLSSPLWHEPLTHWLVFTALAAPVLVWNQRTRRFAVVSAVVWCVVMALLSSQWVYLPTLAAMFLAFPFRPESGRLRVAG